MSSGRPRGEPPGEPSTEPPGEPPTEPFRAWHLPLAPSRTENGSAGELDLIRPVPEATLVERTVRELRQAGDALARRSTDQLIDAIDTAAARLADHGDPLRRQAEDLLPLATGYSPPMVRLVLDRMAADWRAAPLRELVERELGWDALDGFGTRGAVTRSRAYGPRLCFQVFAGNVPGVAVTSIIRALLVRAPTLGKLATDEPVLPVLFARALASVDAELARAVGLLHWPGGDPAADNAQRAALDAADTVVVYGGREAVEALGNPKPGVRVVVHGPRFSAGAIGAGVGDEDLTTAAADAALAVATFDQHGCVSPHAFWVEDAVGDGAGHSPRGNRAAAFAELLAAALERLEAELPRGRVSGRETATIQQERGAAELRSHQEPGLRVWTGGGTRWTVVLDPDPAFRPSCLNRFVRVHPVPRLESLPGILAPAGGYLQSFALEGAGNRLESVAHGLGQVGATRITTLRRLPWPPPTWHHDGASPLQELVRWVDLES